MGGSKMLDFRGGDGIATLSSRGWRAGRVFREWEWGQHDEGFTVELKPGTRLRSTTDTTEVIVVRAPADDLDLRCGGAPFAPMEAPSTQGADLQPGFDHGTMVGKRYGDEDRGIELLCTKGGPASISIGADILTPKGSKALPASD